MAGGSLGLKRAEGYHFVGVGEDPSFSRLHLADGTDATLCLGRYFGRCSARLRSGLSVTDCSDTVESGWHCPQFSDSPGQRDWGEVVMREL